MSTWKALTNGNIITMEPDRPRSEAVLIEGAVIAGLGTTTEIETACRDRGGEVHDLARATVVPGFHDCHVHMMGTGINARGLDLHNCSTVQDVLDLVVEAARTYPEERWIFGKQLDESRLREGRTPTAAELDAAASQHPVYLVDRGWHYTVVNTAGFHKLGLSPTVPGVILDQEGQLNGRLCREANAMAKMRFFEAQDRSRREEALTSTVRLAVQKGLTTLHAMEGGSLFADSDVPYLLELRDRLPVRIHLYWATEDVQAIKEAGLPCMGGDILLDGSIGPRTAAFSQPYADDPGTCGQLHFSTAQLVELISHAHREGLQIAFHAIGEAAIAQALEAFETVLGRHPCSHHRHRLEHFGFPHPSHIEQAARLGLAVSTQPAFSYLRGGPGSVYNTRLGPERDRRGYPLRAMVDAELLVGGGSDSDVTPLDPLLGIHAAVNPPYPENALDVYEALALYTIDAARTAFQEQQTGSIARGKLADLTLLGQDPVQVLSCSLKDIPVLGTMNGGEWVFRAGPH